MSLFHLIAPSGYCIKQHAALRGIQRLTDAGHQVNNVEVIARRCERFAVRKRSVWKISIPLPD